MSRITYRESRKTRTFCVSLLYNQNDKNMNQEEKAFIIRAYDKAELAELYSPGRTAAAALQTLYRWMRRNMLLQEELNEAGYNKFRHSFLKHEVAIIVKHLGEP